MPALQAPWKSSCGWHILSLRPAAWTISISVSTIDDKGSLHLAAEIFWNRNLVDNCGFLVITDRTIQPLGESFTAASLHFLNNVFFSPSTYLTTPCSLYDHMDRGSPCLFHYSGMFNLILNRCGSSFSSTFCSSFSCLSANQAVAGNIWYFF